MPNTPQKGTEKDGWLYGIFRPAKMTTILEGNTRVREAESARRKSPDQRWEFVK